MARGFISLGDPTAVQGEIPSTDFIGKESPTINVTVNNVDRTIRADLKDDAFEDVNLKFNEVDEKLVEIDNKIDDAIINFNLDLKAEDEKVDAIKAQTDAKIAQTNTKINNVANQLTEVSDKLDITIEQLIRDENIIESNTTNIKSNTANIKKLTTNLANKLDKDLEINEDPTGNIYVYADVNGNYQKVPYKSGGGGTGKDGLSAYQIAVKHGFKGTETEWLESLQGEPGKPGNDGKDATWDMILKDTDTLATKTTWSSKQIDKKIREIIESYTYNGDYDDTPEVKI